jgi:hypothetical protein
MKGSLAIRRLMTPATTSLQGGVSFLGAYEAGSWGPCSDGDLDALMELQVLHAAMLDADACVTECWRIDLGLARDLPKRDAMHHPSERQLHSIQ